MRLKTSHMDSSNEAMITINGVTMTMTQYNKILAASKKKARKEKKVKVLNELAKECKKMVKEIKPITSFAAYYTHAHRQWGNVTKNILEDKLIALPFASFRNLVAQISENLDIITKMGKKSDKDIFQCIEKLSYQMNDLHTHLDNLTKSISKSNVLTRFKDEKCIYEVGRRLGLKELMSRSSYALIQLDNAYQHFDKVSRERLSAFEYDTNVRPRN